MHPMPEDIALIQNRQYSARYDDYLFFHNDYTVVLHGRD